MSSEHAELAKGLSNCVREPGMANSELTKYVVQVGLLGSVKMGKSTARGKAWVMLVYGVARPEERYGLLAMDRD